MTSKPLSLLLLLLILLLLIIGTFSIGAALYLSAEKSYTVYDENVPLHVSGRFQTVADVIDAAAITLRPEDLVTPELQETANPETMIQVQRAKPVIVNTANGSRTIWTRQSMLAPFLAEAGITLQPDQELRVGQMAVSPDSISQQQLPPAIDIIPREIVVSIVEGDQQRSQLTSARTVIELLQEAGIQLAEADRVDPAPDSKLQDGAAIHITRAVALTIAVDDQSLQIRSLNNQPLEVLGEIGVVLGPEDYTFPPADTILQSGDTIEVIRVSNEYRFEDEEIPFQTVYQPSDELDLDSKAVLSNGVPGIKRRRIRLIYEDGVQVGEELEEEWIESEPLNQVIGYGTRITLGTIDTPEGPREYWRVVHMRATAYTAASSGKAPDHPAYGITASGLPAGTGIVAVDPNVVPFRSEVFVPGYGIGFAGDTGGGIKGRWIDLGYDEEDLVTWNGYADVYYLTPIPEKINYLLPEVLP